jgi:ketosteroid isomerase-like protein
VVARVREKDAIRETCMRLSVEVLAGQYHQAWIDHDPDAIAALHTQDSVFHMHGFTDAAVGRASVRELVAGLLRLVPNLNFEAKRAYVAADHIVFEYDMSGTSDGSDSVCDGADVIAVSDGLVARKDTYLDLTTLISQVGPLPKLTARV